MKNLTIAAIEKSLRENESWSDFYQDIAHKLGKITKRDKAVHRRNLHRVAEIKKTESKYKFNNDYHKPSYIEDEFKEFRIPEEVED